MIVIFGNNKKEFKEAEGKFFCPKCKFMKIYNVKTNKDYFQLFFLPIFPISEKSDPYVECQNCKNCWEIKVLEDNNYYLDETPVIK